MTGKRTGTRPFSFLFYPVERLSMSVTTHASFLLEGNVSKRLAAFSAPLVAANLLQYVYQFVDMGIVGNVVGETGLVAVSNASAVVFIISSIAIGLMSGCTVVVGERVGALDEEDRKSTRLNSSHIEDLSLHDALPI